MKLYDSLTREVRDFKTIEENKVRMYTCGPTVYSYVTVGNWRTYTLGDLINRSLKYLGYEINYVMNITDVGHLTGDNLGDADTGEDRLEKAAKKERKTAWDIAEVYTQDFLEGFAQLNLIVPQVFSKATDHIQEQIDLVKEIEEKGFAYKIKDGIYFDTKAYEAAGNTYGELSNLDQIKEGARVEINPEKRDARDFALWKFSPANETRDMEWESPWGKGFPGWHIECSAMSMKYLGDQLDVHIGGEDLRSTHHPNEIAQSEAATGIKPFTNFWMHGAFLLVDNGKMGKSLGNAYRISDVIERGFDPMALRYFYLGGHYRKQLNFTWDAIEASSNAYTKLVNLLREWSESVEQKEYFRIHTDYKIKFTEAINDDLNLPQALAVLWEVAKDQSLDGETKISTILDFDRVLGLKLEEKLSQPEEYSLEVKALIEEREQARSDKNWSRADEIRNTLKEQFGVEVKDKA